ncbi:MAG: glycosyltransferase family 4 protein [Herpetosiphon sp.]|nr:glycosyltransferase family 4 protein [Herpetosiphon sp.]
MTMRKKIAFIKIGDFSFINPSLIQQMERMFPEYDLDVIDLKHWINSDKTLKARFTLAALREYWKPIMQRKRSISQNFFSTHYSTRKVKQYIQQRVNPRDYVFTFETQSMFDASVPTVPHFMYTDHTVKANLRYPVFDPEQVLFSKAWSQNETAIYGNPDVIFTASEFARQSVIEDYGRDPNDVECVYTGINVVIDPPQQKQYNGQHILFVGVEWERKGGPEVVAAFEQALKVCPDARLTIVGCSPTVNIANCNVIGRIPREQVAQYYRDASIFFMPSRIEPAGIAFTEAAMYKLPIISAKSGGIPDRVIHGETGYLANVGDVDMMATYLIDLLQHPARCQQFGEAGYHLAQSEFTWDRVGERIQRRIQPFLA